MTKQQMAELAFKKTFIKKSEYPDAFESSDREIVVVFDPYFLENFDMAREYQTFGFSNTEELGRKLRKHIKND